jgi:PEGA domain
VNVDPWAQVSIDGKLEGYTPKRKQLPAGRYTVRMTKESRSEDVVVVISPGKVSTVERSFR